ncbi:putative protein kinase, partial [Trypanosoma grayi]|uniref:putative protein kinase n=1 Tax=Trypanosoma grayi TaxID=71804 RepID=UPI0004F478B9
PQPLEAAEAGAERSVVSTDNKNSSDMTRLSDSGVRRRNETVCGDGEQSRSFDWPSRSEDEEDHPNSSKWVRTEGPTAQELLSLFRDARDSPFEFLLGDEDCAARFRRSCSVSLSTSSFGVCLGRGNYGFVVPAVLRTDTGEAKENARDKSRSFCRSDDNVMRGTEPRPVVAIKVSRLQAAWSLDEVVFLRRVTERRQSLEQEVKALQEQLQAAAGATDAVERGPLEAQLQDRSTLLGGARLVSSLVGDVMYDVARDALLLPLEFYPSSLGDCIRARRRRNSSSFPTCGMFTDTLTGGGSSSSHYNNNNNNNSVGGGNDAVITQYFSVEEVRHVARSLCYALHFLHTACSLCHLDVKAENILLSRMWGPEECGATMSTFSLTACSDSDPLPQVVLGDLGLAQPLGTPIQQLGDFSTMAPEVYWASACNNVSYAAYRTPVFSGSSDIWSVGCVLLQMMNGLEYGAWGASHIFSAMEENFVSPAVCHPEMWPMELN